MRRFFIVSMLLVGLLALSNSVYLALAQDPRDDTVAIISAPVQSEVVTGQVEISGSASHPSLYVGYELEFDNLTEQGDIWFPIGQRITQPVTNGILGVWDTVTLRIPDGTYQIRLRVFLSDDSAPVEFVVRDIQVLNTAPTALPTLPPDIPTPTSLPIDVGGPTSTPLIVQPATSTPRATIAPLAGQDSTNTGANDRELTVNFGSIQSAFCSGSLIAFIFFGLLGGYMLVRVRLRPMIRQMWWQVRNEFDQDR